MNFPLISNLAIFVILLLVLMKLSSNKDWSLSKKVLTGLVIGVLFGLGLNAFYGTEHDAVKQALPQIQETVEAVICLISSVTAM
mgnify:CR=1 FL=1